MEGLEARAIGIELEHRASVPCAAFAGGSVERAVFTLDQSSKQVISVLEVEGMENPEACAVGVQLEHHASIVCAAFFGGTVECAIPALKKSSTQVISIVEAEGMENPEARTVGIESEHRARIVYAAFAGGSVERAVFTLSQGGYRRYAIVASGGEGKEGLKARAIGFQLDHPA